MRAHDNPRVEWAQQSGREFGELPGGKPKRELVLLLFGAKHFQDHFYEVFEFRLTSATGHAGIVAGDAPGAIGRPHFLVDIDRRQDEQPWRRIFVAALLVQSVHLDGNVPQLARRIGLEPGSIRVNWSAVGHRENVDGAVAVALSARAAAGEQNCLEAWLLGFQPGDDAIEHWREMISGPRPRRAETSSAPPPSS